jgi:pimeloyl-ACP methyl ester carboxylesterase
LLVASLLCLGCIGCASSRSIARRALEAPNRQFKPSKAFRQLAVVATNFPVQQIQVGPPPATLELMVIEPGDYGAKMISRFTRHRSLLTGMRAHYRFQFGLDFLEYPPQPKLETNNIRDTIFLLPGYSSDKNYMLGWGLALAQAGFRTVLVDLRGHGHATGDRIYFGGIERTDMVQCLDSLVQRGGCAGAVGALGISYGAAVDSRVQSVAAISPYADPGTAVEAFLKAKAPLMPKRMARKVAGIIMTNLAAQWPDLTTETAVRGVQRPILFVRGERDKLSSQEFLNRLQAVAPKGSEVIVVPIANHLNTGLCIDSLEGPVTNWFRAHLTR